MVKEARYRLFGTSTRDGRPLDNVNRPKFVSVPLKDDVWEASFAKSLLQSFRFCSLPDEHRPVPERLALYPPVFPGRQGGGLADQGKGVTIRAFLDTGGSEKVRGIDGPLSPCSGGVQALAVPSRPPLRPAR